MANRTGAKILTVKELDRLTRPLPEAWIKAGGLLRHKKIDPIAYQRKIRKEWEDRLRKLEKGYKKTKA